MKTIRWNKLAGLDYFETIDYLLQNWSKKEAQNFIDKVFKIESILAKGNVDFQGTDRPGIKRCVINKQITLFYRHIDKNNIELLRIWNNYQESQKMK